MTVWTILEVIYNCKVSIHPSQSANLYCSITTYNIHPPCQIIHSISRASQPNLPSSCGVYEALLHSTSEWCTMSNPTTIHVLICVLVGIHMDETHRAIFLLKLLYTQLLLRLYFIKCKTMFEWQYLNYSQRLYIWNSIQVIRSHQWTSGLIMELNRYSMKVLPYMPVV